MSWLDGLCFVASALVGSFMLWLGGSALVVGGMCFFLAGAFFERAWAAARPERFSRAPR